MTDVNLCSRCSIKSGIIHNTLTIYILHAYIFNIIKASIESTLTTCAYPGGLAACVSIIIGDRPVSRTLLVSLNVVKRLRKRGERHVL